jgi:hypothetical protein
MCEQQLDLFSSAGIEAERPLPLSTEFRPAATVLDDQALIAAIPDSNLNDSIALAAEAGRRTRTATLTVNPPGLQVTPTTEITASGTHGGPFSPSSFHHMLSATYGASNTP